MDDEYTITIDTPSSIPSDLISITPVQYEWNITDTTISQGFTAQEVSFNIDDDWVAKWEEVELWREIRHAAEQNETLQEALNRVKVLYYLSKDDDKNI